MRRIIATTLTLAAAGALIAGCGKSDRASFGSVSMTFTKAQAVAYANAVNLRAADVPGLVGARLPHKRETRYGPFGAMMERCDGGVVNVGEVIGLISQRFKRSNARQRGTSFSDSLLPIESVHSAVYLMGSAALASKEFNATDSSRARRCLKPFLVDEHVTTVAEGATVAEPLFSQIEVSALPSLLRGVRVYGLRMTAGVAIEAPSAKGRSNYYEDFFGFVVGSALITLNDTCAPHAFPSATERRLLALLYRRAEAQKL